MHFIRKSGIRAKVGYHPDHAMRLAAQGKFPKPVKLGDSANSAVGWFEEEVDAWLAERATASRQP